MDIRYKSDLYCSQIQIYIPAGVDRKGYTFQMLERNSIKGVLKASQRVEEGKAWLYLDTTGKRNLLQEYKEKELGLEEMTAVFRDLLLIFDELREFLLNDRFVLLEPEFIYRDLETQKLFVAVLPWEREEERGLRKLAEFFLEKMNPKDDNGINIAYLFYKQQGGSHFSLSQFLPVIERENILKRQRQREREGKQEEETFSSLSYPLQDEEEERVKRTEGKKKRGFFYRLFHPEKKVDPKYDLSLKGEERNPGTDMDSGVQPVCGETVFFEEYREEWKLVWKEGGRNKTALLETFPFTLGKLKGEVSLVIEDRSVSRIHCRFLEEEGRIVLMDMDSTNGTFLNGMKMKAGEKLGIAKNDEILVGKVRLLVV